MSEAGKRILAGIQDAIDGNFASVTIDGQRWMREDHSLVAKEREECAKIAESYYFKFQYDHLLGQIKFIFDAPDAKINSPQQAIAAAIRAGRHHS